MHDKQKSSLLLTLGSAFLLIGGGVAVYWILTQRNYSLGNLPVGANMIPQDALLTVSFSTKSNQWEQLREFGTKQTQTELERNLAQLRDRFLTTYGYNYQQDIQPWVGDEVTIAFLPTTKLVDNQQHFVLALPIANQAAAKQILEKPLKQGKWIERNYQGVQIKQMQGAGKENYAATVLDQRFLVVSNYPQAIETAINTYNGGASLAKTPGYTQAMDKIAETESFASLYINIPASAKITTKSPSKAVSPQGLAQLQNYQGLATTVNLAPDGIKFKSISWLTQNASPVYLVENQAGEMSRRLPAETLLMISGGNLQRLWQDYTRVVQSNPLTPIPPQNLRTGVKSITGMDLDQDLLAWMKGEFALAVIPAALKTDTAQDFALSLVFMTETSDRTAATKALNQLDEVMKNQYQFQIQKVKIGEQPVVNWISPYGTLTGTHGWLDKKVAFLALGAPISERIIPKPAITLASTEQFQKTVPSQLSPHNGQIFVDLNSTVKALPIPQFLPNTQPWLEAMRSIGVTTAVNDERSIRYDVFVSLKQAEKLKPLPSDGDSK